MSKLSYIITGQGITAVVDGETMTITSDNPSYGQVLGAIKNGEEPWRIAELFRAALAVKRYMQGAVEVDELLGEVTYNGEPVHNVVVDRILQFMSDGLPVDPLIKFLENLMLNPSARSRAQGYKFLEHKSLPITEDGCFLGYKSVTADFRDHHTGEYDNSVGAKPKMDRGGVDDDFRVACGTGFHIGSLEYGTTFAGAPRVVVCKVNPKDIVSVPEDSECQKLRCCEYEVVAIYQGAINRPLVTADAPYSESFPWDNEDDDDFPF